MEAEKRSDLVQGFLAGSTLDGEAPKDVETRSKLVLGVLAGLALGVPASFASVTATPNALAGSAAVLMMAVYIVLKLRPPPAPTGAPPHGRAVFLGAAATTASSLLVPLLVSKWFGPIRFSSH